MRVHNSIIALIQHHGKDAIVFDNGTFTAANKLYPIGKSVAVEDRYKFSENYKITLKNQKNHSFDFYISDFEQLLESKSITVEINGEVYDYKRHIECPQSEGDSDILWGFDQDGSFGFLQDGIFMAFHKWARPTRCNPLETIFTPLTDANSKGLWHRVCTAVQEFKIEEDIK